MAGRFDDLKHLTVILANKPREFPSALLLLFKRFVRNIWDVRGGGLYACGFVIMLVWLEASMLVSDLLNFSATGGLFDGSVIGFVVGFFVESIMNTVQAFIWPVAVIEISPPWGAIGLGLLYAIFPSTLKKPLEKWIFGDEDDAKKRGASE